MSADFEQYYQQFINQSNYRNLSDRDKKIIRAHLEERYRQQQQDQELHSKLMHAQQQAAESQRLIDQQSKRQYAVIVAVDLEGGFSKDGQIPWHYPDDMKWFKMLTNGHICVMGRKTYDDINNKIGDNGAVSVLPDRTCYVVTSSPLPRPNAVAIKSCAELNKYVVDCDVSKIVFFIGGELIYEYGISIADVIYTTIVNKVVNADKFFQTDYVLKHFFVDTVRKVDHTDDLRFVKWIRK